MLEREREKERERAQETWADLTRKEFQFLPFMRALLFSFQAFFSEKFQKRGLGNQRKDNCVQVGQSHHRINHKTYMFSTENNN